MKPYSDAADERQKAIEAKEARGEKVTWSDLLGICEPNPDLPDCQSHADLDYKCERENGHDGMHRHVIEWGYP